jgi:cyclase
LARLSELVNIPLLHQEVQETPHFVDSFLDGKADAALAASVFHFKEMKLKH